MTIPVPPRAQFSTMSTSCLRAVVHCQVHQLTAQHRTPPAWHQRGWKLGPWNQSVLPPPLQWRSQTRSIIAIWLVLIFRPTNNRPMRLSSPSYLGIYRSVDPSIPNPMVCYTLNKPNYERYRATSLIRPTSLLIRQMPPKPSLSCIFGLFKL